MMKFLFLSLRVLLLVVGLTPSLQANPPSGIIGGSSGYAAHLFSPQGVLFSLSISGAREITSTSTSNAAGVSLIGGKTDSSNPYGALISPTGLVTRLSLSTAPPRDSDTAVAINGSGAGLIGSSNTCYRIASNGSLTPLSIPLVREIAAVSINNNGLGLIGGWKEDFSSYGAYVGSDGTITEITGLAGVFGPVSLVTSLSINNSGDTLIASINSRYPVKTSEGGTSLTTITGFSALARIRSLALNDSNVGLVGGDNLNGLNGAGIARIASDGTVTLIPSDVQELIVSSVALNSSGTGIAGGSFVNDGFLPLYAAFIGPDGTLSRLSLNLSNSGSINSVSINEAGVGLIGGSIGSHGYGALVAPNGTVTVLDVPSDIRLIYSVSLIENAYGLVPSSVGHYTGAAYAQLAAAAALESRFLQKSGARKGSSPHLTHGMVKNNPFVANADLDLLFARNLPAQEQASSSRSKNNSIWLAPFGTYVWLAEEGDSPSYVNQVGGSLLGYDYTQPNWMIGAAAGYGFNYVHYGSHLGHGKIQEELLSLYGSYSWEHLWIDAAFWGGAYQFWNTRHTPYVLGVIFTTTAKADGWIFSPHFEIATPWAIDQKERYWIEPFAMADWVNTWNGAFTEEGHSGFSLVMDDHYGSLLQSEAGLRFYEKFSFNWGDLCLEEKLSYINQAPFYSNSVTTSFISSASSFPISVGSSTIQNLASGAFLATFTPQNNRYPWGGISIEGTANGQYQSCFASLFAGLSF